MNVRSTAPNRKPTTLEEVCAVLRPQEWEDDISRNALDTRPFENRPPIAGRHEAELKNSARLLPPDLLAGRSLVEFALRDTWPIPSAEDREGYSPGYDGQYWMSGLSDYLKVAGALERLGIVPQRILDFGCASGRFIRHWVAQSEVPEIWGTDINQRHIRWLYEHLPERVKPVFNHCIPTLPVPDNYLDLVSAFSVFTHIDTFETAWLAELRRVLRPGGVAWLTVHNEDTWAILRGEIDNPNNRLVQSIRAIDPEFPTHAQGNIPEGRTVYRFASQGPYRAQVFHSNSYLRNVWGRFFELQEIIPAGHVRQTVVLLRKPASAAS